MRSSITDIREVKQKNELILIDEAVEGMKLESNLGDVEHLYYYPENENLVDGINEFVADHNADMVAIIPHRYTLLESLFHKSVSKKLDFHTNIPLLVLPDNHKSVSAYLL